MKPVAYAVKTVSSKNLPIGVGNFFPRRDMVIAKSKAILVFLLILRLEVRFSGRHGGRGTTRFVRRSGPAPL